MQTAASRDDDQGNGKGSARIQASPYGEARLTRREQIQALQGEIHGKSMHKPIDLDAADDQQAMDID